jgi:hypothetical protein
VGKRLTILVALAGLLVLLTGAGGAGGAGSTAGASAAAVAIRVVVPGQVGAEAGAITSPPYHAAFGSGFTYPADGSIVSTGPISTSASSDSGTSGIAAATSQVQTLSLFGGEITAETVKGAAHGSTRGRTARGDFAGATISSLTVLGSATAAAPNGRVELGDWGYLVTLEQGTDVSSGARGTQGFHGFVTALAVHLTAPHGSLPAGAEIRIGYAEANVQASVGPAPKPIAPARSRSSPSTRSRSRHHRAGADQERPLLTPAAGVPPACSRS